MLCEYASRRSKHVRPNPDVAPHLQYLTIIVIVTMTKIIIIIIITIIIMIIFITSSHHDHHHIKIRHRL
jgi:hypothetical protein